MEDIEKIVVLDSDDEEGDLYGDVNLVNERFPAMGRLSCRDATRKRRRVPAGCIRRIATKVNKYVHVGSARSNRDAEVSLKLVDPDFLNPVREHLMIDPLDEGKLYSHDESKPIDREKITNYNCGLSESNCVESTEGAESQDNALRFIDHYLSVNDLGSYADVQTRKTKGKSPPPLRSYGSHSLAKRINLESSASKLKTFDWTETQTSRMDEDSIIESKENVTLKNHISNHQSIEKMQGNILSSYDTENIGSNSDINIVNDSMECDEQLDAGLSRDGVEKVEELSHDALGIGLDTQVAAEAMEELMHTVLPRFDTCFAHKDSDKTLHVAKYGETFVGWRSKGKRSKCMKISDVQVKAKSWSAVKRNQKFRAHPTSSFQQEEKGCNEQCSLKELQMYSRRSKQNTGCIKLESSMKLKEMDCLRLSTTKGEENSNLNVDYWTFPRLNLWVHPKGKRTRKHLPRLAISSGNECSVENNLEKSLVNEEEQKGVEKLLVYNRRRKISLVRDQTGSSLKHSVDISSPDIKKPSTKCGILDNLKPSSLDASKNMKSNLLSNGHYSTTLQLLENCENSEQPFNSHPRSPLMRELMRLGYNTSSLPDFLSKHSRKQRAMKKICILFSQNLEEATIKQQKKIVARLGLSNASCCSSATHFVADRFVRTRNMLEAIALGKPVVTHLWLENCEQAGYIIAEKSYILRDEKKEKEIGFNMPFSLTRANKLPLLKGRKVFVTPNVKPSIDIINSLIKAAQGQAVQNSLINEPRDNLNLDDMLIISCKEDYTFCLQFLEKGACIYDSELLLNGIVKQNLEYERHRLFEDFKENGYSCIS